MLIDLIEFYLRQLDFRGLHILLEVTHCRSARNQQNIRRSVQQPSEGHLCRAGLVAGGNGGEGTASCGQRCAPLERMRPKRTMGNKSNIVRRAVVKQRLMGAIAQTEAILH